MNPQSSQLTLHRLFDQQAHRSPSAVALYDKDDTITYAELERRSNLVCQSVLCRRTNDGAIVGLHVDRSIDWVAGMLGILKANATVLPLPPSFPDERKRRILEHAGADLLLHGQTTSPDSIASVPAEYLTDIISADAVTEEPPSASVDRAAFVLSSSGSTGRPKLIVRSHRSFLHRLNWTWTKHPFEPGEHCCCKSPQTTTHAIYELFEPLLRGIPVRLFTDSEVRDLERFWQLIDEQRITRLLVVPSTLRTSIELPGFRVPALKVLVLMGEYVPGDLAKRILETVQRDTAIYSIYGSTEASSVMVCDLRESFRSGEELPLGQPLTDDIQAAVLNDDLQPVASNEIGRLYVSGPALFSAYLGDPDLYDSVWVRPPGCASPLFDTHDDARVTANGQYRFAGRADHTAKIRGFRIDLQEVENALLRHTDIRQAAVLPVTTPSGEQTLVGFIGPDEVDSASVYADLATRLPHYMLPATIVCLGGFPRLANGKIDRARILDDYRRNADTAEPEASLTETERRVSNAWHETLGHRGFGLDSPFFETGGTSLSVFTLMRQLRLAFDLTSERLSERTLYRYPTVRALAAYIDAGDEMTTKPARSPTPLHVTLRKGSDTGLQPLFVIASAGGTLGAYERLAAASNGNREIVGIRDPYLWGERALDEQFDQWVARYLTAIRERQPKGPYCICAYSSAGSFGYEIARRLRRAGERIELLALVDPLSLDRRNRSRYGWWSGRAINARAPVRWLVLATGWMRQPFVRLVKHLRKSSDDQNVVFSPAELEKLQTTAKTNTRHILSLAALMELNTQKPFALNPESLSRNSDEQALDRLKERFAELMPEVDALTVERIATQYLLQVQTQHRYELAEYDGTVVLFQPATNYASLLQAQIRPFVKALQATTIPVGVPSPRIRRIMTSFGALKAHFRCMRDDDFTKQLAEEIDNLLN